MYPNQRPVGGNQLNGSNERSNDSVTSGVTPSHPYYSMLQQNPGSFPQMNLTPNANAFFNRPQNQQLPAYPFGSYPISANYSFGMNAQTPPRMQIPTPQSRPQPLPQSNSSTPRKVRPSLTHSNPHSASLTPRLESSPPLAEACLALSLASSRSSITVTAGHTRPAPNPTSGLPPKSKAKSKAKNSTVSVPPNINTDSVPNINSSLSETVVKKINSQLASLNSPKHSGSNNSLKLNKPNPPAIPTIRPPVSLPSSENQYDSLTAKKSGLIANKIPAPIVGIPLAPDAVRYDNSSHRQQKVALYRYRDDCYKKLLLKSAVPLPKKIHPPPPRREGVKIIYDETSGSSFFRHIPRLYTRLEEVSKLPEILVPIRIDLDINGQHLADTFTWNINDDFVSLDIFAEGLCRDLQFPPSFREPIIDAIKEQLGDFSQYGTHGHQAIEELAITKPLSPDENPPLAPLNELRILIKLDITVGLVSLIDQFEWDVLCPLNSPETFASVLAADLGLGGEFITAIAHSIREQIYSFVKSLVLVGYRFDGGSVVDPNLSSGFLGPVGQAIRDRNSTEKFTPILVELSSTELARSSRSRDKSRRNRAQRLNRRRANAALLPDREPIATRRTLPHLASEYAPTPFPLGDPAALGGGAPSPHSPLS